MQQDTDDLWERFLNTLAVASCKPDLKGAQILLEKLANTNSRIGDFCMEVGIACSILNGFTAEAMDMLAVWA